ncbi:MAG: efflux RND transporter permease subunit [bacterium]|nr:efflux RND transporter permease subunit [bacterium]
MIDAILRFALRNRFVVLLVAILALVAGGFTLARLPVDVFPDLNRPTVTLMTEAPGLAPEEVETLVTTPIESALNGAPGVMRVRSTSGVGLSVVYVEFDWNTDIHRDRQVVSEKLPGIKERLPTGVNPTMGPVASIMGEIMLIGLQSDALDPMEVRTWADRVVRQRLLTVPGVAQVIAIGGGVRQFQIQVDPLRLAQLGFTLDEVERAATGSNASTTGGFLDRGGQEFLVRNLGRVRTTSEIGATVVGVRHGLPVTLSQVADIRLAPMVKRGDASVNGRPAVILSVQKQPGADTVALTHQIDVVLADLEKSLPDAIQIQGDLFRQAHFIEASIANVQEALRDGALLVLVVLFLFLLNLRTTFITLTAIPLSFVITFLVMQAAGISVNTMTLGGLAIAIGELVDDAIVDVENIFRRLRENRLRPDPRPALEVVYRASSEVRNSIVIATLIVVLVFVPLFALGGIEGRMFLPLGIAYIVSIGASLLVSITVTPVLASYLLPRSRATVHGSDGWLVRKLKQGNAAILARTLDRPYPLLVVAGVAIIVAAAIVPFFGREFLPPFNEGTAVVNVTALPGTSLSESNRIGTIAERLLLGVPEVRRVGRRTGRAELDEHAEGVHYGEIDVDLAPSLRSRGEVLDDLREQVRQIPGVSVGVGQPIAHRLDHLLSGIRAQIAIKVFGPDLEALRGVAAEVEEAIADVPGLVDLQIEKQVLVPQVRIEVDRTAAARYGLAPGSLSERLETALGGRVVSQVLEGATSFDLMVRLSDAARSTPGAIERMLVETPAGPRIPLGEVARILETVGPNQINRENVQRRIVVQANASGRDLGAVVADVQLAVAREVSLPPGFYVTYGGQFESQQQAARLIGWLGLAALAGIAGVLLLHLRSLDLVLQIMLSIPLALIGAVAAIACTDRTLSIASLVGFVTLTGIASRNGIMMVSHYLSLMRDEGVPFSRELIVRGAQERLVPVLMTASTAMLALVPIALSAGEPGKEILQPVAVVILGGLFTSTLLNVVITPPVFWLFGRRAAERHLLTGRKDPLAS